MSDPVSKYSNSYSIKETFPVGGAKYYSGSTSYNNDESVPLHVSSTGELKVTGSFAATLNVGDIQIGAVEIKNSDTDDRVRVALPANISSSAMSMAVTDATVSASISDSRTFLINISASNSDSRQLLSEISSSNLLLATQVTLLDLSASNSDSRQLLSEISSSRSWQRYTVPTTLITSSQTITDVWANLGPEVNMTGYTNCLNYVNLDINDSQDVRVKALGKHESGGLDEYDFVIETVSATDIKVEPQYTEFNSDTDQKVILEIETAGVPYLQLQIMAPITGSSSGIISSSFYNKIWR